MLIYANYRENDGVDLKFLCQRSVSNSYTITAKSSKMRKKQILGS